MDPKSTPDLQILTEDCLTPAVEKIPRGQDKVGALQKGMPQQTPLMEKDYIMYKHTFIPIVIPWQGCPVQVSDFSTAEHMKSWMCS